MLSNRNCFKLLVKMISAFPDCTVSVIQILDDADAAFRILGRGIADRSVRDHHVSQTSRTASTGRTSAQRFCVLTILPPVTALAVGLPAQAGYRAAIFVLWHQPDMRGRSDDVRSSG